MYLYQCFNFLSNCSSRVVFSGVTWLQTEADRSTPSISKVKIRWIYTSNPAMPCLNTVM